MEVNQIEMEETYIEQIREYRQKVYFLKTHFIKLKNSIIKLEFL